MHTEMVLNPFDSIASRMIGCREEVGDPERAEKVRNLLVSVRNFGFAPLELKIYGLASVSHQSTIRREWNC